MKLTTKIEQVGAITIDKTTIKIKGIEHIEHIDI
jgi:hypothetical protein